MVSGNNFFVGGILLFNFRFDKVAMKRTLFVILICLTAKLSFAQYFDAAGWQLADVSGKRIATVKKFPQAGDSSACSLIWERAFDPEGQTVRAVWTIEGCLYRVFHYRFDSEKLPIGYTDLLFDQSIQKLDSQKVTYRTYREDRSFEERIKIFPKDQEPYFSQREGLWKDAMPKNGIEQSAGEKLYDESGHLLSWEWGIGGRQRRGCVVKDQSVNFRREYRYDAKGWLEEETQFKNGLLYRRIRYQYSEKGLPIQEHFVELDVKGQEKASKYYRFEYSFH